MIKTYNVNEMGKKRVYISIYTIFLSQQTTSSSWPTSDVQLGRLMM